MKTIGLLAAFGPVAGAHFYCRLLALTQAKSDADYPGIVLLSRPDIPDRLDYLLHNGPSPIPQFKAMTQDLNYHQVNAVGILSATSHAFLPDVQAMSNAPVISLLEAVGHDVAKKQIKKLAILGTSATKALQLYEPQLPDNCIPSYPDGDEQQELDRLIYALKQGIQVEHVAPQIMRLMDQPWAKEADAFLLGCTELHLAYQFLSTHYTLIDSVDSHAHALLAAVA